MTLFIILSSGALYFLTFLLISSPFPAFPHTLVHSWCKQPQLERRNPPFSFPAEAILGGLGANPGGSPPSRICWEPRCPAQRSEGLSYPKPRWWGSAVTAVPCRWPGLAAQGRLLDAPWRHQTVLHLTMNTQVSAATCCPPRRKTSPVTSLRCWFSPPALVFGRPRSHVSACWDLADGITKTGVAQSALLPLPSPARVWARLSQAGFGSSARARWHCQELPGEEGCDLLPLKPPAGIACDLHFCFVGESGC